MKKTTLFAIVLSGALRAAVYEVGPGRAYASIGAVPWQNLGPGDQVNIYYRAQPYKEKWCINTSGTVAQPIVVRGIPDSAGRLPVIDGSEAVPPPPAAGYWNEERGLVKIGGANFGLVSGIPANIVIERLELRNASYLNYFRTGAGARTNYSYNAAAIYIERGENITIRRCTITGNGIGIFAGSNDAYQAKNLLVQYNLMYGNGIPADGTHTNIYTSAIGATFEYNLLHVMPGSEVTNLKDRSSNGIYRYNWIEGGNRQLDLTEAPYTSIMWAANYHRAFVYGNMILEYRGYDNAQIVHYGGDGLDKSAYHRGTLHFYNNTVISLRPDETVLVRLSDPSAYADIRNNIVHTPLGPLQILFTDGFADLRNNWLQTGWKTNYYNTVGTVIDRGGNIVGAWPGFVNPGSQDFRLMGSSAAVNRGGPLAAEVPANLAATAEYVRHLAGQARPNDGRIDMGAFEFR
jgi:hypothetical protein